MITFNVNYNIIIIIIIIIMKPIFNSWNTKFDAIVAVVNFSSSSEMKAWKFNLLISSSSKKFEKKENIQWSKFPLFYIFVTYYRNLEVFERHLGTLPFDIHHVLKVNNFVIILLDTHVFCVKMLLVL